MFKLGYEAYILFSIVAGYTIIQFAIDKGDRGNKGRRGKILFFLFFLPQLFLVSIYPIFSVRSYFGGLRQYEGLYGLAWLAKEYPDDYSAITWLNKQVVSHQSSAIRVSESWKLKADSSFSLVEADGDSYTDYARFSAFTGIPTIIGWPVHEWLWRGSYDVVAPRREDVRQIYESDDLELTRTILDNYEVRYVIVGALERKKYPGIAEWKFDQLGEVVFGQGSTVIYKLF